MLETDRLVLRAWRVSDATRHRELWFERDPRVPAHRRIDAQGRPTLATLEEKIREGVQPSLLVAESRESGEMIGYCGLIDNSHGPRDEPELAFEFFRSSWGRGFATEASWAIIGQARESGHTRLWASVRDWNGASRRVLQKLGFVETDRIEPDPIHGDMVFTTLQL